MKDLITEARELCEKATPGPWEWNICTEDKYSVEATSMPEVITLEDDYPGYPECGEHLIMHIEKPDAAFIARSRTIIPELCDALEKAQAEIEKMKPFYKIADDTFRHWENAAYAMRDDERKKHRWIPVAERLPTGCGYYLSVVERLAPDELGGNNTRVKIMRWLGADWRYPVHIPEWINDEITETVTHWMPLPAAPEKGAEK